MCGIFGIFNRDGKPVDLENALGTLDILEHRGPDGRGYFLDGNVFLGHARLSIIDVEGGTQPIYNEDRSIAVVANGEIYNHLDFRSDLERKGHRFATHSDSEVLIHLYEEEGTGFLQRLNGMFAFVIHDMRDGTLFLARDRIGIKPMYYYADRSRFVFSSEMKTLIRSGLVPVSIDDDVVYQFLTLHYSIPPKTLLEGIVSLEPGHYIKVGAAEIEQRQYWDIESNADAEPLSERDAFDRTESLLLDSVQKRLMSDVPLGLFLSGGIDSSLIAAMMHRIVGPGVKTFSIGFRESGYSELPFSKQVSEMISSDHVEIMMTPAEVMENIDSVIWFRETPISEMADIPVYLLSRAASEKVKVVLTGEGGDEVFGGYSKYVFEKRASSPAARGLPLLKPLMRSSAAAAVVPQRMLTAFELFSERDRFRRYYRWFSYFRHEELEEMLLPRKKHLLEQDNLYSGVMGEKRFRSNLDEMRYLDIKVWLPDNLLLRGDRMSMAASIEARVPFLDHRIVELSYLLPDRLKVRGSSGKYIIKKIAEKYIDRNIIYRKKVGFSVPVGRWLREDLKALMTENILRPDSFSRGYFAAEALETLVDDHVSGRRDNHKKLWMLLNLELWRDKFISRG